MVLVIAIAVASVTCRPYYGLGHQSRKWSWLQVRRMIILCGQNIGQLLLFSVDFTSLRGLLQDHESDRRHGQGGQDGGRRRRLQHWFQIFTIRKFLEHILCVAVVNMQLLVKGRSNFRSGKKTNIQLKVCDWNKVKMASKFSAFNKLCIFENEQFCHGLTIVNQFPFNDVETYIYISSFIFRVAFRFCASEGWNKVSTQICLT